MKNHSTLIKSNQLIASIGAINVDRSYKCLNTYNMRDSNTAKLNETLGGVMLNISTNLTYLGHKVIFNSFIGSDRNAEFIISKLSEIGLVTSKIIKIPNKKTGSYTVILDKEGKVIIGASEMSIMDYITPLMIKKNIKDIKADIWILDCNFSPKTLTSIIPYIKYKTLIATGVSKSKTIRLIPILKYLDYLFINEDELLGLNKNTNNIEKSIKKILNLGTKVIFVTLGDKGAIVASKNEFYKSKILKTNIKDLNGTGDAFCAAAISCIQKKFTLKQTLNYSLACSSLIAEVNGSTRNDLSDRLILNKLNYKNM